MAKNQSSNHTINFNNNENEIKHDGEKENAGLHDGNEGNETMDHEIVMDYTSCFTNKDYFPSRDALIDWVRRVATGNKIVISIKRSDSGSGKKKPRVLLACEREGVYRKPKRKVEPENENVKKRKKVDQEPSLKDICTKKCGCPFLLKGTEKVPFEWTLEVKCGTHNHSINNYFEGHSYAGRLSATEEALVIDLSKCHAPPKSVLKALKMKNDINTSTIRTIYNARRKHKVNQYCGRSQLQYLMSQFVENNYFHCARRCSETNALKELFFSHPISIKLVRAFPKVLLIDCTYKTNRYRLPYLEIVGVTSTGLTFSVASVYLLTEKEENYTWALGVLKDMLGEACMPSVIITDRELALMNAITSRFPDCKHLLCTWHIEKNILAKCNPDFDSVKKWETFLKQVNVVMYADSETEYEEAVEVLRSNFLQKPVNYVMNQWFNPYKEKFVKAWTNQLMHFGNATTNRVESHHASLKRMLGNSLGNFETVWVKCDTLYEACYTTIKASFEKSLNVAKHKFSSRIYNNLRGLISNYALDKLLMEVKAVKEPDFDKSNCKHILRTVYGLPCAHEIEEYVYADKPIPLNVVDAFWRKLDMEPMLKNDVKEATNHRFDDVVRDMAKVYDTFDETRRLIYLRDMREMANPATTKLVEPTVRIDPRGRPKTEKKKVMKKKEFEKSTKRDPSLFEHIQSHVRFFQT